MRCYSGVFIEVAAYTSQRSVPSIDVRVRNATTHTKRPGSGFVHACYTPVGVITTDHRRRWKKLALFFFSLRPRFLRSANPSPIYLNGGLSIFSLDRRDPSRSIFSHESPHQPCFDFQILVVDRSIIWNIYIYTYFYRAFVFRGSDACAAVLLSRIYSLLQRGGGEGSNFGTKWRIAGDKNCRLYNPVIYAMIIGVIKRRRK